jgi:hypothetical protein
MTYEFSHWSHFLVSQVVTTDDRGVVIHNKNLLGDSTWRHDYSELKPTPVRGRGTNDSYVNLGWISLWISLSTLLFFNVREETLFTPYIPGWVFVVSGIVAIAAFISRIVKYDEAWFMTRQETSAFWIAIPDHQREEADQFINEVQSRIEQSLEGPSQHESKRTGP